MDGDDACLTPRKALWRSASWTARSSPRAAPSRPPKPGRAPLQPLAIARPPMLTEWPRPASDDSGHHCGTPCPKNTAGNSYVSDREISRVAEHVYLGSDAGARDRAALRRHGITHVLNCVGSACPEYFRGELQYMTLWLHDSPGEDITSVLYDAFDYLEAARNARPPGRVLVHCLRGASRSAALVIAYLMWRRALPFDDALRAVRAVRNVTDPNLGFAAQLLQCQSRVHAQPPSPGSARRAYRMAPHSPYDPLHLVPKAVDPVRLDSRGAFVLHVPAAIFVWLGQRCEPAMASSAANAARQVVHYERTKGPIITVHEGSEPPDFWDALRHPASSLATESTDLGEAGNRRVELYDLDFEIFRRALKGGVLPPVAVQGRASPTCLPARDSRWGQLRHKFHSGGTKEFVWEANEEEEVKDAIRSPGSLSFESSTTTAADSASTPSTFSPASSSSSDWYSLSPTAAKFVSGLPPLHTRKKIGKDSFGVAPQPLAERRGGEAPPLVLPPPADEKSEVSPSEIVMDWCLSPPFVSEMDSDQGAMDFDKPMSGSEVEEAVIREDHVQPIHPVLFRWPGLAKVEVIHAGVLDSKSVFLLWAPESCLDTRKHKTSMLFVWLGKESQLISCQNASEISMEGEEGRQSYTDKIGSCFLDHMGLPEDTHIEIIREGKEPKQFLNSLFSVHRAEDSCCQADK